MKNRHRKEGHGPYMALLSTKEILQTISVPFHHPGRDFFFPGHPPDHQQGNNRVPCVSNCRFLTSSRTFSWSTCCKMCCRRFSWPIPIRSSFLSVSLRRALPGIFFKEGKTINLFKKEFHLSLG